MNRRDVVVPDADALKDFGNTSGVAANKNTDSWWESGKACAGKAGFGTESLVWRGGRARHESRARKPAWRRSYLA
jgi:hypothetical protein